MRATEFINEEAKAARYKGLVMKYAFNNSALILKAFDNGTPLAYVKFVKEGDELYPQDLWVHDDHRNRGIAKSMYDFLKNEGYVINRSHDQTKAGSGFWDKHRGEDAYVWEEINPDIYHPDFKHELEIDGLRYTAETDNSSGYGNQLIIKVYDGRKEIGFVEFVEEPEDKVLISGNTWVHKNYREQGIATNMYAYAKMLGNDIVPSWDQTDQGERMWRSWNQSKQSKHILPKGHKGFNELDEDATPEILYHVTPTRNVKSILAKGLVPSIGQRSAQLETESNLFLFPTKDAAEDAVMNWLGDEFDDEPLSLLAVSSNGLEGKFTPGAEYEFTVSSPIPPQNIKVISTNF